MEVIASFRMPRSNANMFIAGLTQTSGAQTNVICVRGSLKILKESLSRFDEIAGGPELTSNLSRC